MHAVFLVARGSIRSPWSQLIGAQGTKPRASVRAARALPSEPPCHSPSFGITIDSHFFNGFSFFKLYCLYSVYALFTPLFVNYF